MDTTNFQRLVLEDLEASAMTIDCLCAVHASTPDFNPLTAAFTLGQLAGNELVFADDINGLWRLGYRRQIPFNLEIFRDILFLLQARSLPFDAILNAIKGDRLMIAYTLGRHESTGRVFFNPSSLCWELAPES